MFPYKNFLKQDDFVLWFILVCFQSVAFNSEMTEITINGRNRSEVENLIHRIGYVNTRTFPTPGHRALTIQTDVAYVSMSELI